MYVVALYSLRVRRKRYKTGVLKHIVIFDIILLNINYIYKGPFNLLTARLLVYDIPSSVPVLHNQVISITCRYVGNIFKI